MIMCCGRKNDPGRIRTCNLLIRSQTRYPLRHRALDPSWWLWSQFTCVLARCWMFSINKDQINTLCKCKNVFLQFSCAAKRKKRPWLDSNRQSSDPKSDALSITPQGPHEIVWFWSQFICSVWQMSRDNQQNDSKWFIAWTQGFITLCKCINAYDYYALPEEKTTLAGFEPAIFWSEVRHVIHYATGPQWNCMVLEPIYL